MPTLLKLIKTTKYKKDMRKKIIDKHKLEEEITIIAVEELLIQNENLKELMLNPLSKVYRIEKKKNNLKYVYTARINQKLRMYIKPVGEYPYKLEDIIEVELVEIYDKHYGES